MSDFYDDFKSIVLNKTPLIDVRAPVEFAKGAFLNATNAPIINDEERHIIGICYKEKGNAKAVELGHKLVSGYAKESRVAAWIEFMDANPDALLYCFRGGQRSKISQAWIREQGREIKRLKGGYKAFRHFLLEELEKACGKVKPIILGGRTGSGKTLTLAKIKNSIDLEALANHRGSSFGRKKEPQTSQINFENALVYELMAKLDSGVSSLVFEDEGKHVGSVFMPKNFLELTANAPLVILETPMNRRIAITLQEYVIDAQTSYGDIELWRKNILEAMERIQRRLGSELYRELVEIFERAHRAQMIGGCFDGHREWVELLLRRYYDPMYDYQIEKNASRVVFRGGEDEVLDYLGKHGII